MEFKKKEQEETPKLLKVPRPLIATDLQGEKLCDPDGRTVGVICGWGWVSDTKTPTMRPVVLAAIQGGAVMAFPAELANVAGERLVPPGSTTPA